MQNKKVKKTLPFNLLIKFILKGRLRHLFFENQMYLKSDMTP